MGPSGPVERRRVAQGGNRGFYSVMFGMGTSRLRFLLICRWDQTEEYKVRFVSMFSYL